MAPTGQAEGTGPRGSCGSLLRARQERRLIEDERVNNEVKSFVTMVTNN